MNVLHLTGSLSRDGGGVHSALLGLMPAQQAAGLGLSPHGLLDRHWADDRVEWGAVPVRAHAIRGPAAFGHAPTMLPAMLEQRPDLLHCHGLWRYSSVASLRASRRLACPRVVSPHGMLNAEPLAVAPWRKRLAVVAYEGRHVRGARMLHALTTDEARSIRRFGYDGPICILPNGVAMPAVDRSIDDSLPGALPPDAAPPDAAPPGDASLDDAPSDDAPPWAGLLPEGSRVLLYLGRKDPIKNLPALLDAWELAVARHRGLDGWGLVIAGWGDPAYEARLKADLESRRLSRAAILGPLYGKDKRRALRHASAFVLVSRSEAMPMAALEAAAWRLPLLLTPECRLPQALAEGAAIGVSGDVDGIVDGLARLGRLGDPELRAMGERGRAMVAAGFSWDLIAARFAQAYRWLLGGGAAPAFVETA